MRVWLRRLSRRRHRVVMWLTAMVLSLPAMATAQYGTPELVTGVPAEQYHVEVAGTIWNPGLSGIISSQRLGIIGSNVDFVDDLGLRAVEFHGLADCAAAEQEVTVSDPGTRQSNTRRKRRSSGNIIFNGRSFPALAAVTVRARLEGVAIRVPVRLPLPGAGLHRCAARRALYADDSLAVLAAHQRVHGGQARPLPSIGIVGRAYPIKELALNFEVSLFRVPQELDSRRRSKLLRLGYSTARSTCTRTSDCRSAGVE